jgi:enoyl-CoA hydratase
METVQLDQPADHVTRITLHRPDRLNAMSIELVIDLWEALEAVAADNDCWVVILTGAGRAFSSGLDLKDYGIIPNIDGLQVGRIAQRSMRYYSRLIPKLRELPQPVIAAVNGPAYGGGMCLSLGADLRIAAESAVFNATGIVNGLTSTEMGVSYLLPRLIGAANSNDLLLTGRRIDAAEALRMGLVSRVEPDAELADAAVEIASGMAGFSPVRAVDDQGGTVWAEPRGGQPGRGDRARGPQPADARLHRQPARGDTGVRRGKAPPVYTDEPRRDIWVQPANAPE